MNLTSMQMLSESIDFMERFTFQLANEKAPESLIDHVNLILSDLEEVRNAVMRYDVPDGYIPDWMDENGVDEEPVETVDSDELDEDDWGLLCNLRHKDPSDTEIAVDPRCAALHPDDGRDLHCDESDVE